MLFLTKNKHLNYSKQTNKTNNILRELYNEILEANNYVKNQVKFSLFLSSSSLPLLACACLRYQLCLDDAPTPSWGLQTPGLPSPCTITSKP